MGWYILCQGRAKLLLQAAKGGKFLLQFAKPGDILNLTVFGPHAFSAEAVDHCSVGLVKRDYVKEAIFQISKLENLLRTNPCVCIFNDQKWEVPER